MQSNPPSPNRSKSHSPYQEEQLRHKKRKRQYDDEFGEYGGPPIRKRKLNNEYVPPSEQQGLDSIPSPRSLGPLNRGTNDYKNRQDQAQPRPQQLRMHPNTPDAHEHSNHTHSNTSDFTAQELLSDVDTTGIPPNVHDNILDIMNGNYYQGDTTQHVNKIHRHPGSDPNLQAPPLPAGRSNNFHNIQPPNANVPPQSFFPAQPHHQPPLQPPPQKHQKQRQYRKKTNGIGHEYRNPVFNPQTGLYICPYGCGYENKDGIYIVRHTDACKKNFDRPLVECKYKGKRCPYSNRSVMTHKRHEKDCGYNPGKIGDPCIFHDSGCGYRHEAPSKRKRHQNFCFYNPNKKSCSNADKGCPYINAAQINIKRHEKACKYKPQNTIVPPPPPSLTHPPPPSFLTAKPHPQRPPKKRKKRQPRKKSNGIGHSYRNPVRDPKNPKLWMCPYGCSYKKKERYHVVQHTDSCKKNFDRPLVECKYEVHGCVYSHMSVMTREKHEKDCGYNPNKTGVPCTFQERGCTYRHDKPKPLEIHQNVCCYNPNNIKKHKKTCQDWGNHAPPSFPPLPPPRQTIKRQPVYINQGRNNSSQRNPISSIPQVQYFYYHCRWCNVSDTKLSVVANHEKTCKHNPANRKR